jgi:hypothetical protein
VFLRPAKPYIRCEEVNNLDSNEYARAWNLVREYHMFATVRNKVCCRPGNYLVIVGGSHVQPLRKLFDGIGIPAVTPGSESC